MTDYTLRVRLPTIGFDTLPDPTKLPLANYQAPDWEAYEGNGFITGGVRAASAGDSYLDPFSGVRVTKLTDATFPVANTRGLHDYSEGGPFVSARQSDGKYTLWVYTDAGGRDLIDFEPGVGVSNARTCPWGELDGGFSYHVPHHAFYISGGSLIEYDVRAGSSVRTLRTGLSFTDWFTVCPDTAPNHVFVWQSGTTVYHYREATDNLVSRTFTGLDEPHVERNGRYILILTGGSTCDIWDTLTDTVDTGVSMVSEHNAGVKGYFIGRDGSVGSNPTEIVVASTGAISTIYTGSQFFQGQSFQFAGQWLQPANDDTQYFIVSPYQPPSAQATADGWSVHSGNIYVTDISYPTAYEKAISGVRHVYQYQSATTFSAALTKVESLGAVVEGSFYFDFNGAGADKLYVHQNGGGSPSGNVWIAANGPAGDMIAYVRADGGDARLLTHPYNFNKTGSTYGSGTFATLSPDGTLVIFKTTMNNDNGRCDVFAVEVPTKAYYPNEPAGFTTIHDTSWDDDPPTGWTFNAASNGGLVGIADGAVTWTYTTDLNGGYEPGGQWYDEGETWGPRLYLRLEGVHPSSNFQNHSSGVNKIGFLLKISDVVNGYLFMDGADFDLQVNMQGFPEFGTIPELQWNEVNNLASPTLAQAQVQLGEDNTIEILVDMGTPGTADGTWRTWLNGVLIHDYTGLSLTAASGNPNSKIRGFQHKPIWGGTGGNPSQEFTLKIGHTYISQGT